MLALFVLLAAASPIGLQPSIAEDSPTYTLSQSDKPVLQYNAATLPSPNPEAPWYKRSGFVHPIYSPSGKVLTADFPADHMHQHGLMFAWTSSYIDGQHVDFWNSAAQQGHVEHVETLQASPNRLQVRLRHVDDIVKPGQTVLDETWTLEVQPNDQFHIFDLTSVQTCVMDRPLVIKEYHYGALCIRGPSEWLKRNGEITTDETKSREEGNHTRPKWVMMSGSIDGEACGIVAMSHPNNFRSPQTVRLHPDKPYFCFAPMVQGDFELSPGEPYTSRYRIVAFDGVLSNEQLQTLWQNYTR